MEHRFYTCLAEPDHKSLFLFLNKNRPTLLDGLQLLGPEVLLLEVEHVIRNVKARFG